MNIKPNTSIRQNDFGQTGINSHTKHEEMLKLRAELMAVEENRSNGESDYFVDEVVSAMEQAIRKVCHCRP